MTRTTGEPGSGNVDTRARTKSNLSLITGGKWLEEADHTADGFKDSSLSGVAKVINVLQYIPIINYIYFVFLQSSPREDVIMISPESVREICNMFGLVAALLYTILTAMPSSVTMDELDVIDNHWRGPTFDQFANYTESEVDGHSIWSASAGADTSDVFIGAFGCQYSEQYLGMPMSVRFGNALSKASLYLELNIYLSVVVIVSVSTLTQLNQGKGDAVSQEGMAVPEAAMETWWSWARWVMIFMALILVLALMLTHGLLNDVYYVKFPQQWLEERCAAAGWTMVMVMGDDGLECETFTTRAEITACKYEGGHFVEYMNSYAGSRQKLTSEDGDSYRLDALKTNGKGYYIMAIVVLLAITLLGYAQLFADREAIAEYKRSDKGQQDSEGSKKKVTKKANTHDANLEGMSGFGM